MDEQDPSRMPEEQRRLLLDRVRFAAENEESQRRQYWRDASYEEHGRVLAELIELAEAQLASQPHRRERPPAPVVRVPPRRKADADKSPGGDEPA